MSTHGGARALVGALPHLRVDAKRMRVNLDAIRATLPKGAADEWFYPALAQHAGELALAQLAGWRSQ